MPTKQPPKSQGLKSSKLRKTGKGPALAIKLRAVRGGADPGLAFAGRVPPIPIPVIEHGAQGLPARGRRPRAGTAVSPMPKKAGGPVVVARESGASYSLPSTADLQDRLDQIHRGVRADAIVHLARRMAVPKEKLIATLGLSRATVDRRIREDQPLSPEEGERVLGFSSLVQQVQTMVEESGDATGFDAAAWVAGWIEEPLPALGGERPSVYMKTATGQQLVSTILARMQAGTYS